MWTVSRGLDGYWSFTDESGADRGHFRDAAELAGHAASAMQEVDGLRKLVADIERQFIVPVTFGSALSAISNTLRLIDQSKTKYGGSKKWMTDAKLVFIAPNAGK